MVRHLVAFGIWLCVGGGGEGFVRGVLGVEFYEEVVVLEEGDCGLEGGAGGKGCDMVEGHGRVEGCNG